MWILFELGIIFSRFFQQRKLSPDDRDADDDASGSSATTRGESSASSPPAQGLSAGPASRPSGPVAKSGGDDMVGRDIAGGDPFDPERFSPMTGEEMDAELDAMEAEEGIDSEQIDELDPVQEKLERIMELREREDVAGARRLLYEVLEEGDDEQRYVARNILRQLDAV
jgi:sec-independent protein translocase protein TatC